MIKKFTLLSAAILCALTSHAIIWQYDNYDAKKKTCRFSGWSGSQPSSGKLSIKETTEKDGVTYKVSAIAAGALDGLDQVTELTIASNIASIASRAGFHTMTKLATIKVADNNRIFSITQGVLTSYDRALCLPQKSTVSHVSFANLKDIDDYAFYNCTNLQSIELGYSLTDTFTIGSYAFANSGLTSIEIPQCYKPGDETGIFENCRQLKKIRCENTNMVAVRAFARNCINLTEINFYPAPKQIRQAAFKNCTSLKDFDFDTGIIMKEDSIFYNTGFTSVKFTGEADNFDRPLGAAMFSACRELESINFSEVITDNYLKCLRLISCFADNCPKLKTVEFPKYVSTSCAENPSNANYTFGRNTPINKIVLHNLKTKNNYLVNYNIGNRQPAVYLKADTRDNVFAKDDFCDMKWFFKASDGVTVDASFYCAAISPMMTGVCPYGRYYIPWGNPGNYAAAMNAGNTVSEMFSWTIRPENGVTTFRYNPAYDWVKCAEVNFNGTQSCLPTDNVATSVINLKDMDFVQIVTRVNGVDLRTKYVRNMFPSETGVGDMTDDRISGTVELYNLNGEKILETDARSLDMSQLPSGVYILKSGSVTRKIIR